ncbi:uncharacterized protein LOC131248302 [Magnolia sinica]|uniref:uncharacterized protein LOC131248302 n=1 Tax=Magnolia sinica TaxID=86752 RepID=UPI002657BBB8|nr:uncharacterized protein LOC131248302 [Magnolia sinica]
MSDDSPSDSETDENSGNSLSGDVKSRGKSQEDGVNEYEKQRLLRIRENRAKMEAMGLPKLTSSMLSPVGNRLKRMEKEKKKDKDDEYRPPDGEDGESSSSEQDEEEDRTVRGGGSLGSNRKGKKKNPVKTTKTKKSLPVQRHVKETDAFDDDDALQQAIALSLGGPPENSGVVFNGPSQNSGPSGDNVRLNGRKEAGNIPEATGKKKRRKSNISRVQMSEDEVVAYFFSIDEAGKGNITLRDLKKVAIAHDFDWTDKELADMIECFDKDGDWKLSLDDFRTIVTRCNMIQGSENA